MNKYVYTIIIPHYNIPKLLKRCLLSLPKRDDLQIVVVDDKSSDENIAFLRGLENEFDYVHFVYSDINGGGGRARNIGLSFAEGKYLFFADADDFFNYCIGEVLDEYRETDYDVVFFNASHIDTNTYLPTTRITTLQIALNLYDKTGDMSFLKYLFGEPWCKLVRKEIVDKNNISFEEIIVHNDTKFSYMVGFYAQKVKFDNRAVYCLADRSGSVSKRLSDEKLLIRTRVFAEKNRFLADHNIPIFDGLMISPFIIYMDRRDMKQMKKCFKIAEDFSFSKKTILKKILIHKLRELFGRI